jgi:long-chain acyl-CoA synthetase
VDEEPLPRRRRARPGLAVWIERARERRAQQLPRWPRRRPIRWARRFLQGFGVFPITKAGYSMEVRGRLNFREVEEPCLIISNHIMHLDQSLLLRAMPSGFRQRIAIAASEEDMFRNRFKAFLIELLGNAFPFARIGGGIRDSLEYVALMLGDGWNVLIFPEGELTVLGPMKPFKGGVGLLARETGVPVLPMRIDVLRPGLQEHSWFPPRGRVRVTIGEPIRVDGALNHDEATALLERAVREA